MQGKGNSFRGLSAANTTTDLSNGRMYPPSTKKQSITSRFPMECAVLDLGCGTASFGLMIAKKIGPTGKIDGLDTSEKQLFQCGRKDGQFAHTF